MAEGRGLPWKEQKLDIRPTPDYRELAKPLEPPPRGLEWRRLEDDTWELKETETETEDRKGEGLADQGTRTAGLGEEKEPVPEFLEHVVMLDDTLTGICLKYKVKDRELRRLNGFVGNNFRMCDSLIIPNRFAAGHEGATGKRPMTRDEKMQIFRQGSNLGPQETRFYLEASGWELTKALDEWRAEVRWEAEQANAANNTPRQQLPDAASINRLGYLTAAGATGADTSFSVPSDSTIDQRGFEEPANSHLSVPSVSARLPQGGKLKTQ